MNKFEQKLSSNIWKYTLLLVANKRLFAAIIGAYYLTIPGVFAKEIGFILLLGNITGFLFEVPSGYVSDKLGHKRTLVLSRAVTLLSSIIFLLADNLPMLCVASVLMSLGAAFLSGTGSAFMHETLRDLGREKDYVAIMGKASSIGFAVPAVLMTCIPFLMGWSMKAPFAIGLAMDIVGLWAAWSLVVPRVTPKHIEEISNTNFLQVLREGYRAGFFRIALFSGLTTGIVFSTSAFRAVYQSDLGIPIIYFGVFFGVGRGLAALLLAYSGKVRALLTRKRFYLFQFIGYALLIAAVGISTAPWLIVLLFIVINAFQWGLSQLDSGYMLETIRKSKFKATLLSVGAQIDDIFTGFASYGMGLALGYFSYHGGFLLSAFVYMLLGIPLLIYLFRYKEQKN